MDLASRDWLDLLKVYPKDRANPLALLFPKRIDPLNRNLTPSPRRTAQIHDPRTGHEKTKLVIKLHDLECRPPAIAFGLRTFDIRVVQLSLKPPRGRKLAPARGLDLHRKVALSAS